MGGIAKATRAEYYLNELLPRLGADTDLGSYREDHEPLIGRRLDVRPVTAADEKTWRDVRDRNLPDLVANGLVDGESDESFEELLAERDAASVFDLAHMFGVYSDGQLIGETGLTSIVRGSAQSASIVLWLDASWRSEDLAGEAFTLVCGFAFDQLGLHRVEAAVRPDNHAVRSALESVGVGRRSSEPGYLLVEGAWADHDRYVFTAEDWEKSRPDLTNRYM